MIQLNKFYSIFLHSVFCIFLTTCYLLLATNLVSAQATTFSLIPTDDAYVRGGNYDDENYGDLEFIKTKLSSVDYTREAFLKFDLSSITLSSTEVKYASLIIFLESQNNPLADNQLFLVPDNLDNSWSESTLTWNTKPDSTDLIYSWEAKPDETYQIQVTDQITNLLSNTAPSNQIISFKISSLSDTVSTYSSKEGATPPFLFISDNIPPQADFTATPNQGDYPLTVLFDARSSLDPDGSILSYSWDFGDGQTNSSAIISHTYLTAGTYTPVLTVTDNSGLTAAAKTTVVVGSELGLSTDQLNFYTTKLVGNPPTQSFDISNVKLGTLNWTATVDQPWLTLNSNSGTLLTGENESLTISVNTTNLPTGTHQALITIQDPHTANSPQTIAVTLDIIFPSFPGAEGFGAKSIGGRGGRVIKVTNLDDSGPGSLRECVESSGPRICVFTVGGTIELQSTLKITNPYITIAGQTASGDGITLKAHPKNINVLWVNTHDVIVQYMRMRKGTGTSQSSSADSLIIYPQLVTYNVLIDHCSISWAIDENVSNYGHNITLQNSIISEGLYCASHVKGCHSMGILIGGSADTKNISIHHNLIAHNSERSPRVSSGLIDVKNNLIYNSGYSYSSDSYGTHTPMNYINNLYLPGAEWGGSSRNRGNEVYIRIGSPNYIYVFDNIGVTRPNNTYLDSYIVRDSNRQYLINTPHSAAPITLSLPCNEVNFNTTTKQWQVIDCPTYNDVLSDSGANKGLDDQGNFYLRPDAVDQRIIAEVQANEGKIIDAPSQSTLFLDNPDSSVFLSLQDYTKYGINANLDPDGFPILNQGTPYIDTDLDGIADQWELNNFSNLTTAGLDINDFATTDYDNDAYTDLEEFLNATNPLIAESTTSTNYDLNSDGHVNNDDVPILIQNWINGTQGDFNSDTKVNSLDYTKLIQQL